MRIVLVTTAGMAKYYRRHLLNLLEGLVIILAGLLSGFQTLGLLLPDLGVCDVNTSL